MTKQSYRDPAVHREGPTQSQDTQNSSELETEVQEVRLLTMAVQEVGGKVSGAHSSEPASPAM